MKINTTHLIIAGIAIGAYFLLANKKEKTPEQSPMIPSGGNTPTVTVADPNINYLTVQVPTVGNLC
jgi:hypothetical protein